MGIFITQLQIKFVYKIGSVLIWCFDQCFCSVFIVGLWLPSLYITLLPHIHVEESVTVLFVGSY